MINERQQELACLHALGALSPEEFVQFEADLKTNAELDAFRRDLGKVTTVLALAVPAAAPTPALKQKILGSLPTPNAISRPDFKQDYSKRLVLLEWVAWAAAACLAVTTLIFHRQSVALRGKAALQAEQLAVIQSELAEWKAKDRVSQLKIAMLGSLLESSPKAVAVSLWDAERQDGVLIVQNLTPLPTDKDYQLWVIDPQQAAPIDAGVFTVDEKGNVRFRFKPKVSVKSADKFAVTLEKKGGVPAPQGQMVLAGTWL
jgi:anti-sigma-K factor RskA